MTETSISEPDEMDVAYLFRSYKEMPKLEQKALRLARGKVLDVGCGAGSHALYLEAQGLDVTAIDQSAAAVEACALRKLKDVREVALLDFSGERFDTILLLMNGTGIFGKLSKVSGYLTHLKTLLQDGGQILIDSSDLIYMFDQDEDGGAWIPADGYYGELTFTIRYKGETEAAFDWLYLDFDTLQHAAHAHGFQCDLILKGSHYDYLAKLYL